MSCLMLVSRPLRLLDSSDVSCIRTKSSDVSRPADADADTEADADADPPPAASAGGSETEAWIASSRWSRRRRGNW